MGLFKPFWMKENADGEELKALIEKVRDLKTEKKVEVAKKAPIEELRKAAVRDLAREANGKNREALNAVFENTDPEERKSLFLLIPQYNRSFFVSYLSQKDLCDVLIWAENDNDMLSYAQRMTDHEQMSRAILGICSRGWANTRYGFEAIEVMFKRLNEEERGFIIEKTKDAVSADKGSLIAKCYERCGMNRWN